MDFSKIKASVIIPSADGRRGGNVEKLKAQIGMQTLKAHEMIVVVGVSPNGRARNEGVKKASGDYYVFIDDDVTLGDGMVLENLIRPFLDRQDVGMTDPSQLIPEDSNWFQKTSARQFPRSYFPVQKEIVDSDMVSHMCLAMPAKLFKDVGWENPDIVAGTDPDLRYRVRKAGFRVCVVPHCWAYHPMPATFKELLRLSFAKGRNSAKVRKTHPNLVYELDEGYRKDFAPTRPLAYRIARACANLAMSLLSLKLIRTAAAISYAMGNLIESARK